MTLTEYKIEDGVTVHLVKGKSASTTTASSTTTTDTTSATTDTTNT